ncbi:uncharacterized protein LOC131681817 [Topomyia yanbarensis]|uniref:uncharacterized protein LOC131681817 n=1 Tax=Topomyia yanbarensis TaxID=2498891 RepID=UPI00273AB246|nr:uncharacterized protein LOC131681817 [Topomyia yanbarensis]
MNPSPSLDEFAPKEQIEELDTEIRELAQSPSPSQLETINEVPDEDLELPEGVVFIPTSPVVRSAESVCSRSSRSTMFLRLEALARPKTYCVEDTLQRFRDLLPKDSVENLQKQIKQSKSLRDITNCQHLKKCTQAPTPTPPPSRRLQFSEEKTVEVMSKLKAKLKREVFDRLVNEIIKKLPALVLDSDITDLSQLKPEMQRLINVLFATIIQYVGNPVTVHDHELYVHLCVGIAKFIESVIESVRSGKDPSTEKLFEKRNEKNATV